MTRGSGGRELLPGQRRLLHPLTVSRLTGLRVEKTHQTVRKGTIVRNWYTDNFESEWVWVVFETRASVYRTRRVALLAALGDLP